MKVINLRFVSLNCKQNGEFIVLMEMCAFWHSTAIHVNGSDWEISFIFHKMCMKSERVIGFNFCSRFMPYVRLLHQMHSSYTHTDSWTLHSNSYTQRLSHKAWMKYNIACCKSVKVTILKIKCVVETQIKGRRMNGRNKKTVFFSLKF